MFDARLLGESRAALAARLDAADTFPAWAELAPQLTAGGTVTSVVGLLSALEPRADLDTCDQLLGALLYLAAADGADQCDAVLLAIHAVAGGAARLVRRGFDEGLILGQLTIGIRTYSWRTRTRAVAANLLLDTEHVLCREVYPARMQTRARRQPISEIPVDLHADVDDSPPPGLSVQPADDGLELIDLLMWAGRSGAVNARDLSMLVEYHYAREFRGAGHDHVADRFGVTARTSKRRCTAALQALQAAAPQYLAS